MQGLLSLISLTHLRGFTEFISLASSNRLSSAIKVPVLPTPALKFKHFKTLQNNPIEVKATKK